MNGHARAVRPPDGAPVCTLALWGNFGTLNLGNECTLAAMIDNLGRQLPHARLLCVCSDPADAERRHGIRALPMSAAEDRGTQRAARPLRIVRRMWRELADWQRAYAAMRGAQALLVTGTGILTDQGEGPLGFPYQLFKWCVATKLAGGKIMFVSVGAESITHPRARRFLLRALGLAVYRSYRDGHSAALLENAGFPAARDPICPDLAFSLSLPARREAPQERGLHVAVGLFNYRARGEGADAAAAQAYEDYLEKLCTLIEWLLGRGSSVRVIIGDLAYDEPVRADLLARLRRRGAAVAPPRFAHEPAGSWQELLEQLAPVDLVIASRFHNVLLALMLGKPVISVSYEAKNEALMQQMGLGEYCQTLDGFDVQRLIGQLLALEHNAAVLGARISAQAAVNRRELERQYAHLAAQLSAS
jgi:polysaccharide pyruvyl transferase WcaK-like protein